ncbi:ABC transporter permease [Metasolibacillus meyeri]|uniref:ABC transporter permease n=1 Tax=Metasolibacillus meyeri TaxID=1071052 RepID=A0AAW9NYK2_9BACL|nr:ABC transporter permease [Metasolibacillus meyeri]MEC1180100.1 ABC transporter permease [Metasolibacillus meyeri]
MTFQQFAYRNVFRNFRIYAAFFMASFFSVFVFFIYSMLMFHPSSEQGFLGNVSLLGMLVAEIILMLFSWFFIFYSMKAFLEARSKEFAILLHLGMEKKQLSKLVFLETMLIGVISSVFGIAFGYAFSKFFFMIVREILYLDELPLYFSWEPFVLTLTVFISAFVVISFISVLMTRETKLINLLKGHQSIDVSSVYSKIGAFLGIFFVGLGYILAIVTTYITIPIMLLIIPIIVTIGTYFLFTDTILAFIERVKKRKKVYWRKTRMLSLAEQGHIMYSNRKMFFVVTLVSTLAFLCVGVLSALSSYTSQYDKLNPLGIIYKGTVNNPYEVAHTSSLIYELEEAGLSYSLTRFVVKKQTSTHTSNAVEVFRASNINQLLFSYGYSMVRLQEGEAMFIAYSDDSIKELTGTTVRTTLKENDIELIINSVYPELIFPDAIISRNAIIVSDEDFDKIINPFERAYIVEPSYHLYAFDIANWVEASNIGSELYYAVAEEYLKDRYTLPFYFENAGLNYSYILAAYSLFTLVGLLVVAVFLLAAGSFIYFKLYTSLEREKKQFDVLKRMGLTDSEQKNLITRYLFPQFFLPWGLALMHSMFAFLVLQAILKNVMNVSLGKEIIFAFSFIIMIQVIYFYLIRWRYIAHVRS